MKNYEYETLIQWNAFQQRIHTNAYSFLYHSSDPLYHVACHLQTKDV